MAPEGNPKDRKMKTLLTAPGEKVGPSTSSGWCRFFAPDREGGQIITSAPSRAGREGGQIITSAPSRAGREGGQIIISAPSRAGRRVTKNLDHRAILIYRPVV